MTPVEVLRTAAALIAGDRQDDYGDAEESFGRIAALWSAALGIELEAWQVAYLMVLMKVSRATTSPQKTDNWIDMAAYAAFGAMLAGKEQDDE